MLCRFFSHTSSSAVRSDDATVSDLPASPTWRWSFLVAIAVLLLSGGLAIHQYTRFAAAAALVEHTHQVLDSIDRLMTRLVDAEANHRGFLLTQDRSFLEPYSRAGSDARTLAASLIPLVSDNPPQQTRARRLAELAVGRLDEMTYVLQLNTSGNPAAAIGRITGGLGKRLMDDLRVLATEMRASEATLLTQRARQAELAERGALGFAVVSLLVAVALGFVAISVERSFERRRAALMAEMSARAAAERQALAAAADLQQIESFNRSILDNSGDCIQVLEPDGRVVLSNRPGLALMEIEDDHGGDGELWPKLWNDDAARGRAGDSGCRGQGRRPIPRLSPDRQGHSEMVGRHRHAHSRHCDRDWACRSS